MSKFRNIHEAPAVGTIVTNKGYPEQKWHREVLYVVVDRHGDVWTVLSPNEERTPHIVSVSELRRNWVEVLPEPKVHKVKVWMDPHDHTIKAYNPGSLGLTGAVEVEIEATEVVR